MPFCTTKSKSTKYTEWRNKCVYFFQLGGRVLILSTWWYCRHMFWKHIEFRSLSKLWAAGWAFVSLARSVLCNVSKWESCDHYTNNIYIWACVSISKSFLSFSIFGAKLILNLHAQVVVQLLCMWKCHSWNTYNTINSSCCDWKLL